jgi:hypothetical protein
MERIMTINESPLDRTLRALVGFLFLASPVLGFDTMPYNFLGLIPVVTGIVGICPLYSLLRIRTGSSNRAAGDSKAAPASAAKAGGALDCCGPAHTR